MTAVFAQAILSLKGTCEKKIFLCFEMKKEVLLSIIIGVTLGFGIMGIAWINKTGGFTNLSQKISLGFNKKESNQEQQSVSPTPTITQKNDQNDNIELVINEPENEIVVSKEKLTIVGHTQPLATVVIIWEEGEDILVADSEGLFETEISLLGGPNEIEITAYGRNDDEAKKILTITYSTAKF